MRPLSKHSIPKDHKHMIGKVFGDWLVLELTGQNSSGNFLYKCRCKCGYEGTRIGSSLRNGRTLMCFNCAKKNNAEYGRRGVYSQSRDHLYFIKCGNYIKIGSTDNIDQRMRLLMTSNPYDLELLYYGKGEGPEEEIWHKIFAHRSHRGEWFIF